MDLSTSAKTATTTTKALTTKPTKSFTACEPKTTMNNGNRWKSLLDQLAHLCGRLIEAEGLTSTAMGSRGGIGSVNGGTATVTAYSNGTHRDREDSEAASSSSSIVRQLRELTASIDDQMLNFRPVDHRRLWADTFFTPVVERPNLFEMSIFGFRQTGHQIPLHDHPRMFGFIRPLHGRIRLSSYSWLELSEERQLLMVKRQQQIGTGNASSPHANGTMASTAAGLRPARFEGQLILSTPPPERCGATRVALLEPGTANLHSIQALDDGATFFDLLVPGYKADNRVCTYYSIVGCQREEPKIGDIVWLAGSDRMEENFSMQEYVQTASIGR